MNNKRRIIGILAALLLAVVGTVALVGYVRSAKDKAVAEETLVDVYVVDEFVPQGADPGAITAAVSIEQVPARLKQSGAITDLGQVGDQVAAIDLQPGDQLLAARLTVRDEVSEEVSDKVQTSALLEAERAVGGALQKGDLVGVYLSFEPFDVDDAGLSPETVDQVYPVEWVYPDLDLLAAAAEGAPAGTPADVEAVDGETVDPQSASPAADSDAQTRKTPNVSRLEFRHVLVTNVQTIQAPVNPDEEDDAGIEQVTGTQYVVTLALSPEQSERFVFATEFGEVRLAIDPAAVDDDGTRPVTLGNVYKVVAQ